MFRRLVATADVVIENFRPGVMERLGFGYEALKKLKPGLVYCAISGFGQDGPLKDNPAYDQIVQGLAGVMSVTGDETSAPLRVGYPIADTIGGLTAAFAIAAALVRRGRTGEGECIDVSMLEATLVTMGWQVSNWLIAGLRPQPLGNENMTAAPSGLFATGDGPLNIAANQQQQFETLVRLIGRAELATDPRFAEREDRKRNRLALKAEIESGAGGKIGAGMGGALQCAGRAGRRGAGDSRGARAHAGRGARPGQALLRRAGRRPAGRGGALRLPPRQRRPGAGDAAPGARRRHRRGAGFARLHRRGDAGSKGGDCA